MNWIKERRLACNMTQDKVAEAANIKRASYGNIEKGVRRPSPEVAQRIAKVLGFDWTQFFMAPAELREVETEEPTTRAAGM